MAVSSKFDDAVSSF